MDEIENIERKLTNALRHFEQANEAVKKLTRQDVEKTILQTLRNARIARHRLSHAHKEFIAAHEWRLGR